MGEEIAMRTNFFLGRKLGEFECNDFDENVIYEFGEEQLKNMVFSEYYRYKYDKVQSAEEGIEGNEVQKEEHMDSLKAMFEEMEDFNTSWIYAKTKIIPNGYDKTMVLNETTKKYKALRAIPPSIKCRSLYLYREYVQNNKNIINFSERYEALIGFTIIGFLPPNTMPWLFAISMHCLFVPVSSLEYNFSFSDSTIIIITVFVAVIMIILTSRSNPTPHPQPINITISGRGNQSNVKSSNNEHNQHNQHNQHTNSHNQSEVIPDKINTGWSSLLKKVCECLLVKFN